MNKPRYSQLPQKTRAHIDTRTANALRRDYADHLSKIVAAYQIAFDRYDRQLVDSREVAMNQALRSIGLANFVGHVTYYQGSIAERMSRGHFGGFPNRHPRPEGHFRVDPQNPSIPDVGSDNMDDCRRELDLAANE
jgi:hypothetical protein